MFKEFGKSVKAARCAKDVGADVAMLEETAKLIGNSVYGKTITMLEL